MAQLSGSAIVQLAFKHANVALDLSTPAYEFALKYQKDFSNGTGDSQSNDIWHDRRSLAGSATETLDFFGGVTNAFGVVLSFTKIKGVCIVADANNNPANNLEIGGNGATVLSLGFVATNDKFQLAPGGIFFVTNPIVGWTVSSTTDLLLMANDAATNTIFYDIAVWGVA